jgi:hypothetical protein
VKREIKIFKSFEKQNSYELEEQRKTTPAQRLRNLFYMQSLSRKFRPVSPEKRKITITHGFITS